MAESSYQELIEQRRTPYKTIGSCYCPILKTDIILNSKGFHHLLYDGFGRARPRKARMFKVGLFPLVVPVLKSATSIHEYQPPKFSKQLNKYVEYWKLQAIVGKQNTTTFVILRRIGTGNITFHSVWKKRDKKHQKNHQ